MKVIAMVAGAGLVVALTAADARACGTHAGGFILAGLDSFESASTPVSTPLVEASTGISNDGLTASVALGYGWGERDRGMFPGVELSRVLLHGQKAQDSATVALTYGWFSNTLVSAGFDVGLATRFADDGQGFGPTARLTVGRRGVAVRAAVGVFGGEAQAMTAGLDLVVNLAELTNAI